MAEIELKGATLSFGSGALLDGVDMVIAPGERVGLLGRNGAGKTSLMRVLSGAQELDEGEVVRRPGLVMARLEQDVPVDAKGTVGELVRAVLDKSGLDDWEIDKRLERELERFELDENARVDELSAGMKRRALLARALVVEPHFLILDEPTNHLELEAIAKLEDVLLRRRGALLFVTHDRAFLRKIATRILDLDRGNLTSYECDYATYLERKSANLAAESKAQAEFDKHLAKEEVWIRQGVLARRTRNMGRVRALRQLRNERAERRDVVGVAKGKIVEADRSGQLVLRGKNVTFSYGDTPIVRGLNFELMRGDRVGIVGPNGAGKSTLISLLLQELKPTEGEVYEGTKLSVARFDQLHNSLNPNRSVAENVAGNADMIDVGGKARHVISYLSDFLFTPDQARGGITKLSGGERNRLQLAAILAKPCNLLVLDEPTNDLDLETLELLEEMLADYQGTLLLVSHDREFLENVVTSVIANEGPGVWREYFGGYDDWQRGMQARNAKVKAAASAKGGKPASNPNASKPSGGGSSATKGNASNATASAKTSAPKARKITFTEAHELKGLPDAIEKLDAKKEALLARMATPDYYKSPQDKQTRDRNELADLEEELERKMARWELLEGLTR